MDSPQKFRKLRHDSISRRRKTGYSMAKSMVVPLLSFTTSILGCGMGASTADGNRPAVTAPDSNHSKAKLGQQSKVPTGPAKLTAPPEDEVLPNKRVVEPTKSAEPNPDEHPGKRMEQVEDAISNFFGGRGENGRIKSGTTKSRSEMLDFIDSARYPESDGSSGKRMFPGVADAIRENPHYKGKRGRVARAFLTAFSGERISLYNSRALLENMPRTVTAYIAQAIVGVGRLEDLPERDPRLPPLGMRKTAYWFTNDISFLVRLTGLVDREPVHWASLDSDLENSILTWHKMGPQTRELWRSAGVNALVEPHELARYVRAKMNRSHLKGVVGEFPRELNYYCRDDLGKSGR
ncbi:MAG: hypothetical protein ABII71_02190 [Candidatus Micrarchaeota archaeon]